MTNPPTDIVLEALEQSAAKLLIYRGKLGPEYVGGTEYTVLQTRIARAIAIHKANMRVISAARPAIGIGRELELSLKALDKLLEDK